MNAWAGTVLALGAVLWAFGGTWWAMAGVWASSDTFGHGMLVGPIAAWLVWRRRALFETLRPRPDPVGLVAVAGAASAWAVADLAGVDVAAQYAAVMMIPAVIWTTAGRPVVKAFAFPL
ncbi:MAG: archaeosortase/exosortase family protein, partial [Burkholderiaceae bacterium]